MREVVSLLIWAAGLLLGFVFAAPVGEWIAGGLNPRLQLGIGFAAVFVVVLVSGAFLQRALGALVESTGLSGTDRSLGLLFGAGRGCVLAIVALVVLRPFAEDQAWWPESALIPPLLALEGDLRELGATVWELLAPVASEAPVPVEVEEVVL